MQIKKLFWDLFRKYIDYQLISKFFINIKLYLIQKNHLLDKSLNKTKLDLLKPECLVINVSRGGIIDEEALVETIEQRKLMGAALDVFENEPLPIEHKFWQLPRVSVSPHNAWFSSRWKERVFAVVFENLKRFKAGLPLNNVIDWKKGY